MGLPTGQQQPVMNNCQHVPCYGFGSDQEARSQAVPNLGQDWPGMAPVGNTVEAALFWEREKRVQQFVCSSGPENRPRIQKQPKVPGISTNLSV